MILRRAFLKRMAMAAVACAFLSDIPIPGLESAPEPIEEVCGTCGGEEWIYVEVAPRAVIASSRGYLPEPDGPVTERLACPSCSSPWTSAAETDDRKDAFEAYMSNYVQLITKKMNRETNRQIHGISA